MNRTDAIAECCAATYQAATTTQSRRARAGSRGGWSLMEVMVVLIVMGILISMTAPSFRRAIEQSRTDIAGANLRSIWAAQRLYWLEHRAYSLDLSELTTLGLVDPSITASTTVYVYAIQSADSNAFIATATRTGSGVWTGDYVIDQTGVLSGVVQASGEPNMVPGFQ